MSIKYDLKDFYFFIFFSLCFSLLYIFFLNLILNQFEIFDFINRSPDKIYFLKVYEDIKDENIFSIIASGSYPIFIQLNLIFNNSGWHIEQILILFLSTIIIGYLIKKHLKISEYISFLIFFFPSTIYIVVLNLKDFYVLFSLSILLLILSLTEDIKNLNKSNISKIISLCLLIFLNTYFFYFTKIYLLYFYCCLLIFFLIIHYLKNKNIKLSLLVLLITYSLVILVYKQIFDNLNYIGGTKIYDGSNFLPAYFKTFEWKETFFFPNIIDKFLEKLTLIRVSNIEYNISINSNTLITENFIPNSSWDFIINIPTIFIKSFFPFDTSHNVSSSLIFYILSIAEQSIIIFFIIYYIFFIKKNLINISFFIILIISSFFYFYINPNVGTFMRYKAILQLPFMTLVIIILLKHSHNLFFNKFSEEDFIKNFFSIICLLASVLLFFVRDIMILSNDSIPYINFTIVFLIILTFVSQFFLSPLITSLLSVDNKSISKLIHINILFLFTIIFMVITLSSLFFLTNIYREILFENILYIYLLFLSIPINAILSAHLIRLNLKVLIFAIQLSVPVLTIILIILLADYKNIAILLICLSSVFYSCLLSLIILTIKTSKPKTTINSNYFLKIIFSFNLRYFKKIKLQLFFFLFLFILTFLNYLSSYDIITFYFSTKFILFFILIFNLFFSYSNKIIPSKQSFIKMNYLIHLIYSFLFIVVTLTLGPLIKFFFPNNNIQIADNLFIFLIIPNLIILSLLIKNTMLLKIELKMKYLIILSIMTFFLIYFFHFLILKILFLFLYVLLANFFISKVNRLGAVSNFFISILFLYLNYSNYYYLINSNVSDYLYIFTLISLIIIFYINFSKKII